MSYPDHCHWLRESDIRIQATERAVRRLPHTDNRRRALEHIEAVKRTLDDLDRELLETDEIALAEALRVEDES